MAGVGYDGPVVAASMPPPGSIGRDYAAALFYDGSSLRGMRFGLVKGFFNRTASEDTPPVCGQSDFRQRDYSTYERWCHHSPNHVQDLQLDGTFKRL